MSTKTSRSGGKFQGSHTTVVPLAGVVADIAEKLPEVTKVTPGFIKAGLPSASGHRRVKIFEADSHVLLSIRDNTTHQELYIYTDDKQETMLKLAQNIRDKDIHIAFK